MAISYWELRPGTGNINICLLNHSTRQMTLPKQTTVGEIASAEVGPTLLPQKPTEVEESKEQTNTRKTKDKVKKEVLDKIDLGGLEEWIWVEQKEAQELITEYASISPMSYIDVGKTSLVKHSIKLTDNTPFKE